MSWAREEVLRTFGTLDGHIWTWTFLIWNPFFIWNLTHVHTQTIWRHDNRSNQDFYWVPDYAALRIFEIDSLWKMTCTASPSWVVATQANTGAITLYSEVVHTFDTNIKPLNVVPSAPYMTCRHLLSFSRLGLISGSWTHCHTMKWFHSRMWWTTYNLLQKPL